MLGPTGTDPRSINPWLLHLQKLGLELKCPLCLNFLTKPFLLPCDHIFCNSCLSESFQTASECFICKSHYDNEDLRPVHFLENLVTIYKSLDLNLSSEGVKSSSDDGKHLDSLAPRATYSKSETSYDDRVKGNVPACASNGDSEVHKNVHASNNVMNDVCSPVTPQTNVERYGENFVGGGSISALNQPSSGSVTSVGEITHLENASNDKDTQVFPQLKLGKRKIDDSTGWNPDAGMIHGVEFSSSGIKKSRNITPDSCLNNGHTRPFVDEAGKLDQKSEYPNLVSCNITSFGSKNPVSDSVKATSAYESYISEHSCRFCHSAKVSKDTGPIIHFVDGKQVDKGKITRHAVHVHRICIDWAPRIYYIGDKIQNLHQELARAGKIKCSKCGLKGAALGCCVERCRKTYHVPCAMGIGNCRWDMVNFLMHCPTHSLLKFPSDQSNSERQKWQLAPPTLIAPHQCNFWSGYEQKEWILCGSALSSQNKCLLVKFGNMIGAPVTKNWTPNVSHVIAEVDENGACIRTFKVLQAILKGRWVVTIDWIKACVDNMHPVNEELYEVNLDHRGSQNGPKAGRLAATNNQPKLFAGLKFYFIGYFVPEYKEDLQSLVVSAGGEVLKGEEQLVRGSNSLIVYNIDPPIGSQVGEETDIMWKRLNEAQSLSAQSGARVIGHTWLLESIAVLELQPF